MINNSQIHESRKKVLSEEFQKPYFTTLQNFLANEKKAKKSIFPTENNIFNAFKLTPFDKVKVVILGQDPYHGAGQAHGLAFSVQEGTPLPPSLKNIYKEIKTNFPKKESDLFPIPTKNGKIIGDLSSWAKNGVLLLNTVLTVEENKPHSHQGKGREIFTNKVISILSKKTSNFVFLLWGNDARAKKSLIDNSRHHIIETTHPSPLSAYRGFLGSGCFREVEKLLK